MFWSKPKILNAYTVVVKNNILKPIYIFNQYTNNSISNPFNFWKRNIKIITNTERQHLVHGLQSQDEFGLHLYHLCSAVQLENILIHWGLSTHPGQRISIRSVFPTRHLFNASAAAVVDGDGICNIVHLASKPLIQYLGCMEQKRSYRNRFKNSFLWKIYLQMFLEYW